MVFTSKSKNFKPFLSIIIALALWQLFVFFLPTIKVPSPIEVLKAFGVTLSDGTLLLDIAASIKRVFLGFFLGSFLGFIAGMFFALHKELSEYAFPLLELIRPIPPVAWIPLAILWFGIGDLSAIFLIMLGAFFPVFSNTYDSIRNIKNVHIHIARNFGAQKRHLLFHVLLPGSLPSIFTGLRISMGISWLIVITAELVGASSGLGYMIQLHRILLQTDYIVVGMIVIGIIGLLMYKLMLFLEQRIVKWRIHNATSTH